MLKYILLVLACLVMDARSEDRRTAWIPPVEAVLQPLTNNAALWPASKTSAVLPSSISLSQYEGAPSLLVAEYLAKQITVEELRACVNVRFRSFEQEHPNPRVGVWIVPTPGVMITLNELHGYPRIEIKPNRVPDWATPLKRKP